MPLLEVWLNDKQIAAVGGNDFDVLTFGILGNTESEPPAAQLTGAKKKTDEHLSWFYTQLHSHDKLRVVMRRHGTVCLPEAATSSGNPAQAPDLPARNASARIGMFHASLCTMHLKIGTQIVRASAGVSTPLQATATWHRLYDTLKVELGCVASEAGQANHFWMESRIDFDDFVEFEVEY